MFRYGRFYARLCQETIRPVDTKVAKKRVEDLRVGWKEAVGRDNCEARSRLIGSPNLLTRCVRGLHGHELRSSNFSQGMSDDIEDGTHSATSRPHLGLTQLSSSRISLHLDAVW